MDNESGIENIMIVRVQVYVVNQIVYAIVAQKSPTE